MDKGREPKDRPRREEGQPAMDEERQTTAKRPDTLRPGPGPGEKTDDDRSIATEEDDEELELDDDDEDLDDEDLDDEDSEDEGRPARPVK